MAVKRVEKEKAFTKIRQNKRDAGGLEPGTRALPDISSSEFSIFIQYQKLRRADASVIGNFLSGAMYRLIAR